MSAPVSSSDEASGPGCPRRTDDELTGAVRLAPSGAAGFVGRERHGLVPGARAEVVVPDALNVPDALVRVPARHLVVAGGEVVVEDGEVRSLLSLLALRWLPQLLHLMWLVWPPSAPRRRGTRVDECFVRAREVVRVETRVGEGCALGG